MTPFFQKLRPWLLCGGILLLILGFRIFIGIRFVAAIPQIDDWATIVWLQNWANGNHDWSFIWQRHNGHIMVLYNLLNLGQYLLNGYWDGHLDFLAFTIIHTLYAAVAIFAFQDLLTPRDRGWLLAFIFLLFALPFAGYRIGWGNEWPHSAMMLFSLWGLARTVYHGQSWNGVVSGLVLVGLASLNMASGCLGALALVSILALRAAVARRLDIREGILLGLALTVFLTCYLTGPHVGGIGLGEALDALLKSLAWPGVFIPGAGLLTLVPLAGLAICYVRLPAFRSRNVEYVLAVGILVFLVAVAAGALRGENNNMGLPSGRYTDYFIMVPLVCAVALCLLCRGTSGRYRLGWAVFGYVWLMVQVLGFSIQILYRTLPFMASESGEWNEPHKQDLVRDLVRGTAVMPPIDHPQDETIDMPTPQMYDVIDGRLPFPAMTMAMLTGFPLGPGSEGNYLPNGFHPSYRPRPTQFYWGSYDPKEPYADDKHFLSGAFRPQADYLTIDLLVDKKARFSNYRLPGLSLTLQDETTGEKTELLPLLSHSYPFIFRDWELIYVKVTPGHDYRLESSDTSQSQWLAFSEPMESGRLTPFIVGLSQSGKLLCLCGIGLLMLVLGIDRWQEHAKVE